MHEKVKQGLDRAGVPYKVHRHDSFDREIRSPMDFSAALGVPPEHITKAVFLVSRKGDHLAMALCSVTRRLDLAAIAEHLGAGRMTMAKPDLLAAKIGYPSKGVSPVGVAPVPVFMDRALLELPSLLIGAGAVGVEVEIRPDDLVRAIQPVLLGLTSGRPHG